MSGGTYGVIIPCYNSESTVIDSLDSVMRQSVLPSQIVIVNDGSTDRTEQIVQHYISKIPFAKLITTENHGLSSARNLGLASLVGCEFVAFLDSDDIWHDSKMELQLGLLRTSKMLVAVCSDFSIFVTEPGIDELRHYFYGASPRKIILQSAIIWGSGSAVVMRMGALETNNLFDIDLRFAEDLDAWCKVCEYGEWGFLPEKLVYIRQSQSSMQGSLRNNPDLYLHSYLYILDKWSGKLRLSEKFLKRYDVLLFLIRMQGKNNRRKAVQDLNDYEVFKLRFPILSSVPTRIQKPLVFFIGTIAFFYRRSMWLFSKLKYAVARGRKEKQ